MQIYRNQRRQVRFFLWSKTLAMFSGSMAIVIAKVIVIAIAITAIGGEIPIANAANPNSVTAGSMAPVSAVQDAAPPDSGTPGSAVPDVTTPGSAAQNAPAQNAPTLNVAIPNSPNSVTPDSVTSDSVTSDSVPPTNVLLITIDTLRADHLGCYGYKGIKTPNIDALARQGVLFQQAYTPVPVTFPSHVSILTGTYPPFHGVRNNGNFILSNKAVTLAEILADHGYRTAAFIGAYVLDSYYGLDQGFQRYNDDFSEGADNSNQLFQERNAEQVTQAALKWLGKHGKSRFFIWLHYFDPHAPYAPPSPFLEEYRQNPYDGEIAYTDHWLGVLFRKLEEWQIDGNTLIILCADHGESLGEHGEGTHGIFIYDSTLRVPLIMKGKALLSPETVSSPKTVTSLETAASLKKITSPKTGTSLKTATSPETVPETVSKLVRTLDIVPTVLEVLGINYQGPMEGKSLLNLINGQPDDEERVLYCESYLPYYNHGWSPLVGLRTSDWKYIRAPKSELYDLTKDPIEEKNQIKTLSQTEKQHQPETQNQTETQNRIENQSKTDKQNQTNTQNKQNQTNTQNPTQDFQAIKDQMEKKLQALLSSITPPKSQSVTSAMPDQDHLDRLMSLGYIRTASPKMQNKGSSNGLLSDPKDKIGLLDYLNQGMGFLDAQDPNRAIAEFTALLKQDQGNVFAHLILGSTYHKKKLYDLALEEFQKVVQLDDAYMDVHCRMASVYQTKELYDKAIEEYKRAIHNHPRCAENYNLLATTYISLRQYDEAIEQLKECLKLKPEFVRAHNNLGLAYGKKKNYALSIEEFQNAVSENPSIAEIYNNMGCVYLEVGILLKQKDNIPQFPISPQEMEKIYGQIPTLKDNLAVAFDLAQKAFEKSLQIDARYKDARINLGIAYLNAGSLEKAVAEYQKILADDPADIQSRLNLAAVYLQGGSIEQGKKGFQDVLQLDPNNIMAHYYLGSVYLQMGQMEKATAEYRRMTQIQPRNPDAHFYLGEAYRANGQTRQAIEEYRKSLEQNPHHIRAQKSLSLLNSSEDAGKK